MPLTKPLHQITLDDLNALVGQARESKMLEFKADIARGDQGHSRIVAGVSALANTSGGDFIIGVTQDDNGFAAAVPGVPVTNLEAFTQAIESILRSRIEPQLPNVDLHAVSCGEERWAVVIRTSRSWLGPHRNLFNNHFYVRTSDATRILDVPELRVAFGLRENGADRIEAFRRDRLVKIMSGETPVRLRDGAHVVLHLAPLPSFINRDLLDLADVIANGSQMPVPLRGEGRYAAMNLLGVYNHLGDDGQGATGYGQLFRSGAYEGVSTESNEKGGLRYIVGTQLGNAIVGAVRRYIALQEHYQFDFPTFGMISVCNAAGLHMVANSTGLAGQDYLTRPLQDDVVAFPEFVIEGVHVDVAQVLRAPLNVVWNAFELPLCQMYNQQGGWMGVA
jgi:hypothetical protein